jgi:hypothetical protein
MQLTATRLSLTTTLWASLALIATAGLGGAWLGYAEDIDSLGIARSLEAIQAGGYERSRVYGVPLYELFAAGVDAVGGVVLVNLCSAVFCAGACYALWQTLRRAGGPAAPFALLAAMSQPLILINASAMMETAAVVLCVCVGLWAAVEAATNRRWTWIWTAAAACALGVASRPDAALFALAVGFALALEARPDWRRAVLILAAFAVCGLAALGLYGVMNGGYAFVFQVAVTQDEAGRSFGRAVLGAITVVSLPGALILAGLAALALKAPRSAARHVLAAPPAKRVLVWIAIAAGGLYAARFLALPDELEYLLPAALALFAALGAFAPRAPMIALALCLMLSNIVQIALFTRQGSEVAFTGPSLQPGALVQDWDARAHNRWLRDPQTTGVLAALAGVPGAQRDNTHLWLNGVVFEGGAIAIGQDQLYRFSPTGDPTDPHVLANYRHVLVCQAPLVLRRGWRVLQPLEWSPLDPARLAAGCRRITPQALPDAASPTDAG